jgi:thiamine biosynthesis lipoprotein
MQTRYQLFLCLIFISIFGCSKGEIKKYQDNQILLGTQVSITVFSEDAQKANRAIDLAFQRISELEAILTKYKKDSDIGRLNLSDSGWIKVSPVTFEVIKKSVEFGKISNGAFDITIDPILRLWEEAQKRDSLPSSDELKRVTESIGYTNIMLRPKSLEVRLKKAGMSIDLGGIGKGYIVDEAVKVLKSQGIRHGLIDAGGDLYILGDNPERGRWRIGIRNPLKPDQNLRYLEISNKAVATSGHYMRFYTVQGKRYSHIIDPRTGWPVQEKVASVVVIAPDATTADAMATAIIVLGPDKGVKLAESIPGLETLIVTREGDELAFTQSTGFPPE